MMNFDAYFKLFQDIIETKEEELQPPYNNPDYLNYTKLNFSRCKRWLKTGVLDPAAVEVIKNIQEPQEWTIITEPWCGDAAHSIPFMELLAAQNPLIQTRYELRDAPPFIIEHYLTRGSKSIPKLIIRNAAGEDLATWGPRPAECQQLFDKLMSEKADFETVKTELQNWYNHDKGEKIVKEIVEAIRAAAPQELGIRH